MKTGSTSKAGASGGAQSPSRDALAPLAPLEQQMRAFWDAKARENAWFYIATWIGYRNRRPDDFFCTAAEIRDLLAKHGYLPPDGRARMLEIGCGVGRMTRGFAELFHRVDAIDVSPEMVRQAREYLAAFPNVHVWQTTGTDLSPLEDGAFDLVFSYIVFQHLPSFAVTRNYILESARVLRPGGVFLFQVNDLAPPREYSSPLLRFASRMWRRYGWHTLLELRARLSRGPRGFDHPAWVGHSAPLALVRDALQAAGLELEHASGEGTAYLWIRCRKSV